jgi:hypothetical protein
MRYTRSTVSISCRRVAPKVDGAPVSVTEIAITVTLGVASRFAPAARVRAGSEDRPFEEQVCEFAGRPY